MAKLIILFALALLLSIYVVDAKPYQQFTAVDLRHSVRINDAPTVSALCNVTVINPNGTVMVNYQAMSPNSISQTYNYTLSATNTTETGTYNYDVTCLDAATGFNKTNSFSFEVNHTGKDYTIAQSITYFFLFILALCFFFLTLFGSLKIPYANEKMKDDDSGEIYIYKINYIKYLKLACIVLCYCFLIILSFLAYNISGGILEFYTIGYIFQMIFLILIGFALPIILIVFINVIINLLNDKKLRQELSERFIPQWQ